jgi:peptide/nickel transport system substrate-binding protein
MHWLGDCTCIWHPAAYETFSQAVNFELMFSNLIDREWSADGLTWQPRGDLADSWEISPDGLVWTFHLHPGVKWHDGTPFTANDVKFTINRSLITPIRFTRAAWEGVAGAKAVVDGTAKEATGINVIDDNTIALTLAAPNSDYFSSLADPEAAILPQHILEPTDPKAVETIEFSTTKPIGTGPYKFVKYETDQYSEFIANHDYFRGAPKIEHIFVKRLTGDQAIAQLESGDLDLSVRLNPAEKSRLEKVPTLDVLSTPGVGTFGPYYNMLRLTDVNCRKAMAYAIDAQGIVDSVFGGAAKVNRGVTPGMPAADDQEYFDYNPDKAKDLFNQCQAGQGWDKSQPVRIIFDKSFAGVEQWVPIYAQNLEAAGFKTELNGMDSTAAIEAYNKIDQWEIIIAQGGDQGAGPFRTKNYYVPCTLKEPAVNQAYFKDCKIDELYDQATKEIDDAKRIEIFKQIEGIINKAVFHTSLWTTNALSAKAKGLQGVSVPANTREFIASKVWLWTLTK